MVTLNDVAKRAGVSKTTVSRMLNKDPSLSITTATKERIWLAVKELGYQHKRTCGAASGYQIAIIHKESHYQNQLDNALYFAIRYGMESMCHLEQITPAFIPFSMLKSLQGRMHQVYTGVAVLDFDGNGKRHTISHAEETKVYVHEMTDEEIRRYIAAGESMDKAGAYGVQGRFAAYIDRIEGDYYNVVGLPVAYLYHAVKEL